MKIQLLAGVYLNTKGNEYAARSKKGIVFIQLLILGNCRAWNCTSTLSASSMNLLLLEGRASHGHSWSQSLAGHLTVAGKFLAHAHSMAQEGTEIKDNLQRGGKNSERKESQGKLRPSKRGVQWTMVQHQPVHSWGSKPNLAANKLCQQPWANLLVFSCTNMAFCSFLPLSPSVSVSLITVEDKAGTGMGCHADSQKVHIQLVMVTETLNWVSKSIRACLCAVPPL